MKPTKLKITTTEIEDIMSDFKLNDYQILHEFLSDDEDNPVLNGFRIMQNKSVDIMKQEDMKYIDDQNRLADLSLKQMARDLGLPEDEIMTASEWLAMAESDRNKIKMSDLTPQNVQFAEHNGIKLDESNQSVLQWVINNTPI